MDDLERRIKYLPVTTFAAAAVEWQRHKCESGSDVCGCEFRFSCPQCGISITTFGEEMPFLIGIGGKCEGCHYGVEV